jgi:antitoxin component of RelBE/YafQ-DinJ toxin-antitoxin module
MPSTLKKKKQNKVATTIRLDPDLRNWAKSVAEKAGTDISTFITISLTDIRNGNRSSPLDPRIMAYNKYLDDMTDRIDRGEEEVYGPFEWEEAIKFLMR